MIKFSEKKYDVVVICDNCGEVNLVSPKVGTPLYQTKGVHIADVQVFT